MAISYPLTLPDTTSFRTLGFGYTTRVGMTESEFTGKQQVFAHQGQRWSAELALVPKTTTAAAAWLAFLVSLDGRAGSFLFGDPLTVLQGSAAGTPLVKGAHSAGVVELAIDGLTPSATGVFKAGDRLQIGTGSSARLYMNLQDVDADGAGEATLDLRPRLRLDVADNASLVTASPQGLFRLATNRIDWSLEELLVSGVTVPIVEVL